MAFYRVMGHILFFLQVVDACIYCSRALFPSLVSFSYSLSLSLSHAHTQTDLLFLSLTLSLTSLELDTPLFFLNFSISYILISLCNSIVLLCIHHFSHNPSHSFSFKCTCSHHSLLVFSRCYTHKHILLLFLKFCLVGALCFCHFPLFIMFAFMVVKE